MKYIVADIEFDCSLEDEDWTEKDQQQTEDHLPIVYIGTEWKGDNEDDVIEEISCKSGWCIRSIDLQPAPKYARR
jgi:hypothetical protein